MVEEVAKNIYRIGVRLPHNPLKELTDGCWHYFGMQ